MLNNYCLGIKQRLLWVRSIYLGGAGGEPDLDSKKMGWFLVRKNKIGINRGEGGWEQVKAEIVVMTRQ